MSRGFGLLEALVALVLLSSVGLTLMAWVQQNLDTIYRLRDSHMHQHARNLALSWVRTLNPMNQPAGEIKIDGLVIRWQATLLDQPLPQIGYPQGIGKYEIALFDTVIQISRQNEASPWLTEKLILVGYRRAGVMAAPFR